MTNFLTSILGAITGANPAKKEPKTETTNTDTNEAKKLTEAYQSEAEYIVGEFGTGSKLSQKALQESSLLTGVNKNNKAKVAELLGTLPIARVAQILRAADNDGGKPDGKVTPQERAKFMNGLVAQIENGASPERIQAGINAKFLKNGGEVSDAKKTEWLEQFKEFDIPESAYTPKKATEDTDTTEEATGLGSIAEIVSPLIQSLMSKKEETSSTEKNANQASIDAQQQKQQLEQQLQLQQQLQTLNASSFNPSSLGAGAFPNALLTIPTLPTLSINDFNPLLAGGNNIPPAQTTPFAPPPVAQPFTFAPAQPTQTFAQAPLFTPSSAWTPVAQAPVAQAQAPSNWNPINTTTTPIAQNNGGW
jgi:hypothetical protein